jgi:hypothetical protein
MFFDPDAIDQSENGASSIIQKVQTVIYNELDKIKNNEFQGDQQPIILFYRLKNLIHVSTSML